MSADLLSIYIHIPFCVRKCPYCDFNSYGVGGSVQSELESRYVAAVCQELAYYGSIEQCAAKQVKTVFLGGGTPSLLTVPSLNKIIESCAEMFHLLDEIEITMEANPGTINEGLSLDKLREIRACGFNRISFGSQSFSERKLKFLSRYHTAKDISEAVSLARQAGFDNLNLDLIFGLKDESEAELSADLQSAISLKPEHISAYQLTIEPGTEFGRQRSGGTIHTCSEEEQAGLYQMVQNRLSEAGYRAYEISNFSLPGYESQHNLGYWTGRDYLGIGAGAHGYLNSSCFGERWVNFMGPEDYIRAVSDDGRGKQRVEQLTRKDAQLEYFLLRLRCSNGIERSGYRDIFGADFSAEVMDTLEALCQEGFLERDGGRYRATLRGFSLLNSMVERITLEL